MTVVLTDLWENERRVSSPAKSLARAICQAQNRRKLTLGVLQNKGTDQTETCRILT